MLTTPADLVTLASHEVYPGHHTEHVAKEEALFRRRGQVVESIQLVPTPQAVVSEGIAETGLEVVLDDALERGLEDVLRSHGLQFDLRLALAVDQAREPLRKVSIDAALLLHEDGCATSDAQEYLERWALCSPEQAMHSGGS